MIRKHSQRLSTETTDGDAKLKSSEPKRCSIVSKSLRTLGQVSLLYSHPEARLTQLAHVNESTGRSSNREKLLESGTVQLVRANALNTVYLKIGSLTWPLLRRMRWQQIGTDFVFRVPSDGHWKLELVGCDESGIVQLNLVLTSILHRQQDVPSFEHVAPIEVATTFETCSSKNAANIERPNVRAATAISSLESLLSNPETAQESHLDMPKHIPQDLECPARAIQSSRHLHGPNSPNPLIRSFRNGDLHADFIINHCEENEESSTVAFSEMPILSTCDSELSKHIEDSVTNSDQMCDEILSSSGTLSCLTKDTWQNLYTPPQTPIKADPSVDKIGMPETLSDLFQGHVMQSPYTEIPCQSGPGRPVFTTDILKVDISEEEWDLIVDDLDAKNKSLLRNLTSVPVSHQERTAMTMTTSVSRGRTPGLLGWTGDCIYQTAHMLAFTLRKLKGASETNELCPDSDMPNLVTGSRSEDLDDLEEDLDGAHLHDLVHLGRSLYRAAGTIHRSLVATRTNAERN